VPFLFFKVGMSEPTQRPRRRSIPLTFDPKVQCWQPADSGLSAIAPELLVPARLREILKLGAQGPQDPVGCAEYRYPGREALVSAAVLIPLVVRPEGVNVMLTKRAAHLHDHAGQISFPGGRVEATDLSPFATALRETLEETGLSEDYIELLGQMPLYTTATGFEITPVLSLVKPGFSLHPDTGEVAEVFEVPLAFIANPANHRLYQAHLADGRERQYYAMPWHDHFIWGATAAMLRNLYHLIRHGLTQETIEMARAS
jgi:8-oxo-dGTP pyrophosphatase MutT (NUDIX family)